MKNIIYYVSDHGKGHATRTVAICRELKKYDIKLTIRNTNNFKFFKESLPKTKIVSGITDSGPIIKTDGFSINQKKSKNILDKWFKDIFLISSKETKKIKNLNPDLIISDISPMPFLVAEQLKIPSIAISNFSWYDSLNIITKEQKKILYESYRLADLALKIPFGTKMGHFKKIKKIGMVCRTPTEKKQNIKKKMGLKINDKVIFVDIGFGKKIIKIKNDSDIKLTSTNTKIKSKNHFRLPIWNEGQNIVSAVDLVICKLGYGMVSECLNNGTPFYYISDNNHKEQKSIHSELKKMKLDNKITLDKLGKMSIDHDFLNSIPKPKKHKKYNNLAVHEILKIL